MNWNPKTSISTTFAYMLLPALLLAACAKGPPNSSDAIRVDSSKLQGERHELAGTIASVSGYLVSAKMIGHNVCLKVLVDDTLQLAPQLLIENAASASGGARQVGTASLGSQGDLRMMLARADSRILASSPRLGPATVIQACKRPPTDGNEEAIENALQWLDPLKKPDRIENAPNVESLRRELQLFYLERSRRYGWAYLPWEEVVLTGALLGEDEGLEDEVVGGVDLVPYLVAVHDAQRGRWLILDLTFSDGVAKELMIEVIGKRVPSLLGRAGKSTLGF